jgi:galactokinase
MTTVADPVLHQLVTDFVRRFNEDPQVFCAPGRVNLIGEHTDYNDGLVMPAAIEFSALVAASRRKDRKIVVASQQFQEEFEFQLDQPSFRKKRWTNYVQGVAVS